MPNRFSFIEGQYKGNSVRAIIKIDVHSRGGAATISDNEKKDLNVDLRARNLGIADPRKGPPLALRILRDEP